MTSLKSHPIHERPREKLLLRGAQELTTHELFMILLGSGNKNISVQHLAQKVTKLFENTKQVQLNDLTQIKGIGLAKATLLLASLELTERLKPRHPEEVLNSVDKVLVHLFDLKSAMREQVVGLYLNARMKLIHKEILSIGSNNQSLITPKEVFGVIKQLPVSYFILAHNHPSGDTTPSTDDILFTKRLAEGGKILGIELLDHLIIGKETQYSFKQAGKL